MLNLKIKLIFNVCKRQIYMKILLLLKFWHEYMKYIMSKVPHRYKLVKKLTNILEYSLTEGVE